VTVPVPDPFLRKMKMKTAKLAWRRSYCGKSTVNEDTTRIEACPLCEVENMGGPWMLPGEAPRRSIGEDATGAGACPHHEVENM
jgi:hypothetical protein